MGKQKENEIIVPSQEDIKKQEKNAKKEKKNSMLKRVRENYYVAGIAYGILGIGMLIVPGSINGIMSYLLGGIMVFYAVIALIRFFVGGNKDFFQMDFIVGALMAVAGVIIIFIPAFVIDLLPLFFGALLIFGSIINLQDALDLKKTGWPKWKWFMTMAGVAFVVGIVFICLSSLNNIVFERVVGGVLAFIGINSAIGNIAVEVRLKRE